MFWQITPYSDHISRQSFGDNIRAICLFFRLTSFPGLFYIASPDCRHDSEIDSNEFESNS